MTEPRLLGPIVRIQVHRSSVKQGRIYDPAPLLAVERAAVTDGGLVGWSGDAWIVDNHHPAHPGGGSSPGRALSVGFTAHYDLMQGRFGSDTATIGAAAENVIVRTETPVTLDVLAGGLVIRAADGSEQPLLSPAVAEPCVEFTAYLLGLPNTAPRDGIGDDIKFLRRGMRGFVAALPEGLGRFEFGVGAQVFALPS
jgi:hypothetical protein